VLRYIRSWLGAKAGLVGANDYSPVPGAKDVSPVRPAGGPLFEPLEPRLLMNADFVGAQPLHREIASTDYAVYVDLDHQDAERQADVSPALTVGPAPWDETNQTAPTPAISEAPVGQAQCAAVAKAALSDSPAVMQDDSAGPVIPPQQSIVLCSETPSIAIRGPPDLPGLHFVDPDRANLAGQIVYVDFDGEKNVSVLLNTGGPAPVVPAATSSPFTVAPLNVVLVSDAVVQAEQIQRAAAGDTIAIIYDSATMTTSALVDLLASVSAAHNGAPIGHLGIVAHGGPGELDLGKADDLSLATLPSQVAALERLRSVLTNDARLDLYSCSVAAGAGGKTFVDELSAVTGTVVFASDNPVGNVPGADFVWEYHTGQAGVSNELLSVQKLETISGLCLAYLQAPALSTPFNGSTGQSTTPYFSWSPVSGATSYRILVGTSYSGLPTDPTATGGTGVVFNDTPTNAYDTPTAALNPGTTYYWEVHARGAYYGTWSSIYSFTTLSADTTAPMATISSPNSGQTLTTSPITVSGTATDAGGSHLKDVVVVNQANSSSGSQDLSGDSASFSVGGITLVQGSNLIGVQAYDNAGNSSTLIGVR